MERNNLFSQMQHGFVPLRNCMTNLLICMENWTSMLENGYPIDVIYTDFAKAKDMVIIGSTVNWIRPFLSNRIQHVRVEQDFSSWPPVKSGIPQGSVLGPILFVIFINDMPDTIDSMCQLFADDAKTFRSIRSVNDNGVLQNDLDKLSEWSERWQLPFNTGKCKSLHIGKKNKHRIYEMNGQQLDQVKEEKDSGVLIDDELKFHKQTAASIKTANRVLGVVKTSFSYFDDRNLPLIYKSLIRSHLEYGNIVWGPFYKEDKMAIERVKKGNKVSPTYKTLHI